MKINDKTLSSFAASRCSIDKEGCLNKKGEVNHSYKNRWFVLKGNLLFYFEKATDKQPIGVIILENCSVEVSDTDRFSFCIQYQSSAGTAQPRTYILCAENESEMESWIRAISSASYAYINMIVDEFENMLLQLKKSDQILAEDNKEPGFTLLEVASTTQTSKSTNLIDSLDCSVPVKNIKTAVSNAKSKFKTLDTKKFRSTDTLRRSRSSENINKITTSKSMSHAKRKTKNQTVRKNHQNYNIPINTVPLYYDDDFDKSTFETLHTSYGAAIWMKIGDLL